MKKLIISFVALTISMAALAQNPVTLTVEVEGVKAGEGSLRIGVYNSEGDWLKNPVHQEVVDLEKEEKFIVRFENLKPGKYAVSIIHDKNNNGDIDMGMMGPTEAYGFSNNARGMFGPATFQEAAFDIDTDKTEKINIR